MVVKKRFFFKRSSLEASSKGRGTGPGNSRPGHSAWELWPLSSVIATSIVRVMTGSLESFPSRMTEHKQNGWPLLVQSEVMAGIRPSVNIT